MHSEDKHDCTKVILYHNAFVFTTLFYACHIPCLGVNTFQFIIYEKESGRAHTDTMSLSYSAQHSHIVHAHID